MAHIGGKYRLSREPFLLEGAQLIQELGSENIFVELSPAYSKDYPGTDFGAGVRTLTDLARSAPYRRLFDMPFKTYLITAFAFSTWGWIQKHPRGAFNLSDSRAETAELAGLTDYLLRTYHGTGKTFILKNWEGDWLMDETYDPHRIPDPAQLQAMVDWFAARHRGILLARKKSGRRSGVRVLDAVEFNLLSRARKGLPCVLKSVAPKVPSDFLAYSSWETINGHAAQELRRRILNDLAFIRGAPGAKGRPVLISEYGFPERRYPDSGARTAAAARAFMEAGVPKAFYWEIIDNECKPDGACAGFGLVRRDGSRAPAWGALQGLLDGREPTGPPAER